MKEKYKYHYRTGENVLLNKKNEYLIRLDLDTQKDTFELDFDFLSITDELAVERNSRYVSVDTILPTPLGRRKKKSFTAKSKIIKFRCSIYEKKLLKIKAQKSGLTVSEYFRRIALEYKITERLTDEHIEIYKMLIRYHNNFKSIGNMFKKRNSKLSETVYELANEIKRHLKKLET